MPHRPSRVLRSVLAALAVVTGVDQPFGRHQAADVGSTAAGTVARTMVDTGPVRASVPVRDGASMGEVSGATAPSDTAARAAYAREAPAAGTAMERVGRAAVRRMLRESSAGTYIDDILLDHDSALARWPDRSRRPLTVWVQPDPDVWDFDPVFVDQVRGAFAEWQTTGVPVRFDFVADSAAADVHVTWVDHFAEPISGKTVWSRDDAWWIVDAQIVLAVHHAGGESLNAPAMHAIALHEVGHLLGLDHTPDDGTIMTPRVRVRELTEADRATVRLLYSLPPGTVR